MNEVAQIIRQAIAVQRVIPFEEFMRLALYCPVYGYYEKEEDNLGQRGDYYTSVSVGSLFGELLAFQFADWLEEVGPKADRVQILEVGAHRGRLAKDILDWLREYRPELFERLEYGIIEPSNRRKNWQAEALKAFSAKLIWFHDFASLPHHASGLPYRIIFSNELLDSMPVHRLGWDATARSWFEWGVTTIKGAFAWARMPINQSEVLSLESRVGKALEAVLPDGFTIEIGLAAEKWIVDAARALVTGKLVTIDYGLEQDQIFTPARTTGTLRAYVGHRCSDDVLANPGGQDLTAHVNFTAMQAAAEAAGLQTETFVTQEQFLTRIAARMWQAAQGFPSWTPVRNRQFQTLTHPEHLGRAFRVLVQSKTP